MNLCENCDNCILDTFQQTAWKEIYYARCKVSIKDEIKLMEGVTVMSPPLDEAYRFCSAVRGKDDKCPDFKEKTNEL